MRERENRDSSFSQRSPKGRQPVPLSLTDTKLKSLYAALEAAKATDPALKLGGDRALEVLAAIGDGTTETTSYAKILTALKKAGISRGDQISIVKKGMSSTEKADLAAILESGSVPCDADTKAFFEGVLGRIGPGPLPGRGLKISADQSHGLSGFTQAGASIEAINISAAPTGRLHMDDTTVIGKADASGKFEGAELTGDQKILEGDLVRTRARFGDGTTSDWVTVKARGVAANDTRNAEVSIVRIGLVAGAGDQVAVSNINASRQVSEPGAKLQFTNTRTNEKTSVTITDIGGFPDGFSLKGKAGDTFSVAATDGVNNPAFSKAVGDVKVPGGDSGVDLIKDPALHHDELNPDGTPKFGKTRFTGPVIVNGVSFSDAEQGQLGDCYFPAAMAAIAAVQPDAIKNMIKDNGNGTYTVTFKDRDSTGRFNNVTVNVDGDLYVRSYGGALYGHSANSDDPKEMELWFPLIEKAYATWRGSYDAIGNGGNSDAVFQAVLGKERAANWVTPGNTAQTFAQIKKSLDAKSPVAAGTYGESEAARYTNSGVYADHAYSILKTREAGGKQFVTLRNPWGESEPANNGANDGVFELEMAVFAKLYQNIMYVNP